MTLIKDASPAQSQYGERDFSAFSIHSAVSWFYDIMKLLCFIILMSIGFVSSVHAAEFIPGSGLAKLASDGKTQLGSTEAIPCAENYDIRTTCYRWTPSNSELNGRCYRANLIGLQDNFPESEQIWVNSSINEYVVSNERYMMIVNYGPEPTKKLESKLARIDENKYYPIVYGVEIDCT